MAAKKTDSTEIESATQDTAPAKSATHSQYRVRANYFDGPDLRIRGMIIKLTEAQAAPLLASKNIMPVVIVEVTEVVKVVK